MPNRVLGRMGLSGPLLGGLDLGGYADPYLGDLSPSPHPLQNTQVIQLVQTMITSQTIAPSTISTYDDDQTPTQQKRALLQRALDAAAAAISRFDELGGRTAALSRIKESLYQLMILGKRLKDDHLAGAASLLHNVLLFNAPFDSIDQLHTFEKGIRFVQERATSGLTRDDKIKIFRLMINGGLDTTPSLDDGGKPYVGE